MNHIFKCQSALNQKSMILVMLVVNMIRGLFMPWLHVFEFMLFLKHRCCLNETPDYGILQNTASL